jgi:propanediol dehydratase small subunit
MTWLGLVVVLALSAAATLLVERRRFRRFWDRDCTGVAWKTAFPAASKAEIREFLKMFVLAFDFGRSRTLKFEPADRVMDIYRIRYPSRLAADSMELETLRAMARKRYGVDLVLSWHENITLGELFEGTRR